MKIVILKVFAILSMNYLHLYLADCKSHDSTIDLSSKEKFILIISMFFLLNDYSRLYCI